MEIKVLCPGCRSLLRVPATAAGKVAHCPKCQTKFQVPSEQDVMEETVSHWIEQDVEDMEEEFDRMYEQRLKEEARRKREAEKLKVAKTAEKMQRFFNPSDPGGATGTQPPPQQQQPQQQPTAAPARPESPQAPAAPASNAPSQPRPASPAATEAPAQAQTTKATSYWSDTEAPPADTPPAPEAMSDEMVDPDAYPTNIYVDPRTPHLIVTECSQSGVVLAFDATFLEHGAFRLSMPLGCAFSNDRERAHLLARPMAFYDQSQGAIRNAQEIEAGNEFHVLADQSLEHLIASMGTLMQLPTPFKFPMPYYVSESHSNMSLECHTKKRQDGGTSCRVLIPNGWYALDWLRNVNGICGREYKLLKQDVTRLWSDAWQGVDETVRQRLGTWVGFEPGERFRYYFNDAEFGKKDEGLAGVVLTDRRLIYHKYHRKGAVNYSDNPKLIMRPDGDFAGLTVKTADGSVKAAKFRFSDLENLIEIMKDTGLNVDMAKM